jgi:hypothetical protein
MCSPKSDLEAHMNDKGHLRFIQESAEEEENARYRASLSAIFRSRKLIQETDEDRQEQKYHRKTSDIQSRLSQASGSQDDLQGDPGQKAAALREQAALPAITSDNIDPEKEATTPVATSSLTRQFSTSLNKKIYISTKSVTITPPCNTRMTDHPDAHDDGYHSTSSQAPSTHGDEEEENMSVQEFLVENITDTDSLDF